MVILNDTQPFMTINQTLSNTSFFIMQVRNETLSNQKTPQSNSTKIVSTSSKKQHSNGLFNINTLNKTKHAPPAQFKFKPESASNQTTKAVFLTFIPISDNFKEPCNYDTCQLGKCLANGTCECVLVRNFFAKFFKV